MINRGLETIVSFTIAWNIEDKEVRISCLGHIENLYNWIEKFQVIPVERESLKKWLDNQRTYLNETFEECIDKPLVQDICQFDGVLYIKRKIVGAEFNLEPFSDDKGLSYRFSIPVEKEELYDDIINGKIKPVMSYILKKATCSVTKQDYHKSPHSKLLDDNVHMVVEELEGLTFYWSDKQII